MRLAFAVDCKSQACGYSRYFLPQLGVREKSSVFAVENIHYQSFWSLTANPKLVGSTEVSKVAKSRSATKEQVWFAFLQHMNIIPLTGTKNLTHMRQDLEAADIILTDSEIEALKTLLR